MGALRLLRTLRSAAPGLGSCSPNRSCDSLFKYGELLHLHATCVPLPAGPDGRRCPGSARTAP